MPNESYKVEIDWSNKELTAKERIKLKDTSDAVLLVDAVTDDVPLIIAPVLWAELSIHNEKSMSDKDYTKFLIVDENGQKYVTGSEPFRRNFCDITTELFGGCTVTPTEPFEIKIYKLDSKNFNAKFVTCSIV